MRNFNKFVVNIDNLRCNLILIQRLLGDNVKLCAVVKADAYGVGVETVCKSIKDIVDFFAVSNVFEAKEIRDLGINTKILILGVVGVEDVEYCAKNNISITVGDFDYLKAISNNLNSTIQIHLKVNSGLNRYGYKNKNMFRKSVNLINRSKNMVLEGVYTHFATKKEDVEFINIQKKIFDEYCVYLPKKAIKHCANSFATMLSSVYQYDMVRIGVNMYGDMRGENLPLKDVVSIESEVVATTIVQKFQSVGYDRTYTADKTCKVAVVPLGYADGINRKASNSFFVLINGKCANIVGNVCMDCFMVDITGIDNVYIGTKVTIVGESLDKKITMLDWADNLKTSPYDVLLNFRKKRFEYVRKIKK